MRVLVTADAVGGVWTYVLDLCRALRPLGVEPVVAVLGPPPSPAQRADAARAGIERLVHVAGRLEWMDDPWDDVDRAGDELLAIAHDAAVDLVHLDGYAHAALPFEQPVVVVAHSDVVSWWWHVHGAEPPSSWDEYRRRVTEGLRAADAVVAISGATGDDLRRSFGVDADATILDGRSTHWVRAAAKEPFVLGAGRLWDAAKNVDALSRAASGVPWPVVVAGPTAEDMDIDVDVDGAAGAPAVQPLGPLAFDELAGWMARASVFAAPARYEPFGLVALEAALSGCALVLADIASARELWDGAADFVDPDDHLALALALRRLAEDPSRCREQADLARRRAATYSASRMAAAYTELYRSLLARSRPPSRQVEVVR